MICKICELECKSGQALSKHLHIRHNILSKDYYDKYIKANTEGICPICKNNTPFLGFSKGYQKHCSAKCAQNNDMNVFKTNNPRRDRTKIFAKREYEIIDFTCKMCNEHLTTKIGVSNHIRKIHNMTRMKYWKQFQTGKCICGKDTKITTLGFEQFCCITCKNLSLYGSITNTAKTERKRNKAIQERHRYESNHNVISYSDALDLYGQGWEAIKNEIPMVKVAGKKYITDITKIEKYCSINHYRNNSIEQNILDVIQSVYDKDVLSHTRKVIRPLELDFYLPDVNIAIEYNGTFFHAIEYGTPKDYHLNKSLLCGNKNIRLIHIYGFEDFNSQMQLLKELLLGQDNYPKNDFNKNNLITTIPKPTQIYKDNRLSIYGAGPLL